MMTSESILRDALRLIVWYPVRWVIILLPVPAGIAVLRTMGAIHFLLSSGKRRLIRSRLVTLQSKGLINGNVDGHAREYFRNHYVDRLIIFLFQKLDRTAVDRIVDFEGLENLDIALAGRRGAVLMHGHFGPVHLPLVALARLGYRMKQIGLPSDDGLSWVGKKVAFRLRLRYESMIPAEIIKADSFLRPAFKWLHDNGAIMVTGDGTGTDNLIGRQCSGQFLGSPLSFPLGPVLLAHKTGAAVLPLFIVPGEKKAYRIIIERPLQSDRQGDDSAIDIGTQFIRRLESHAARHPGYLHILDRPEAGRP
jgi:phosphatidylinositol dimannoside acyltransferase